MNWTYDMSGISSRTSRAKTVPISQGPSWKRTAKEQDLRQQIQRERRRRYAERDELIWAEVRAIDRARFRKLPWPVRAIGAMLDFVLRRPSP
jgi:hypothetical protein